MSRMMLWDISQDKTEAEHLKNKAEHTGEELRDRGIEQAVSHAGEDWAEQAYHFLRWYIEIRENCTFMAEDVRQWSKDSVPEPPSNRAWGGIIAKAAREGLIERVGYRKVKNAKAHCTPAAVWRKK